VQVVNGKKAAAQAESSEEEESGEEEVRFVMGSRDSVNCLK
jgi:hypothetical protein